MLRNIVIATVISFVLGLICLAFDGIIPNANVIAGILITAGLFFFTIFGIALI